MVSSAHILFVRHGETMWNVEGRCQGSSDTVENSLTARGYDQALNVAKIIETHFPKIAAIYTSHYLRANSTASTIRGNFKGINVFTCDDLREIDMGKSEGKTYKQKEEQWGEAWAEAKSSSTTTDELWKKSVIPEGESYMQAYERSNKCMIQLAKEEIETARCANGKEPVIIVVSHGKIGALNKAKCAGQNQEELPRIENCQVINFNVQFDENLANGVLSLDEFDWKGDERRNSSEADRERERVRSETDMIQGTRTTQKCVIL